MKLKRIIAFVLASMLMMSSMMVFAKEHTAVDSVDKLNEITDAAKDDTCKVGNDTYVYDGKNWNKKDTQSAGGGSQTTTPSTSTSTPCGSSSQSTASSTVPVVVEPEMFTPPALTVADIAAIVTQAETVALQNTAKDEGFANVVDLQNAAAMNMSAGEYYNNAAIETPGIEEATPVAQGGGIIINGVVTNAMATISKVDVAFVDSVRASVEGTVLNVVDVKFPALEATINFYMPGVAADANVVAVQYVDGAWVDVEVVEVRADHVVLNLKQNGKVAFLAK